MNFRSMRWIVEPAPLYRLQSHLDPSWQIVVVAVVAGALRAVGENRGGQLEPVGRNSVHHALSSPVEKYQFLHKEAY